MMNNKEIANAMAWQRVSRMTVSGLLILSGIQFLAVALVYRAMGSSEDDKLIFAGCLAFAAFAFALCAAFWKAGASTWKHKVAVALVALPAALSLITQ